MNETGRTVYVHEFQVTRLSMTEDPEKADMWARLGKKVWEVDLDECERYDDPEEDQEGDQ